MAGGLDRILNYLANTQEGVGAQAKAPPNSLMWPNGAYSDEVGDIGIDMPTALHRIQPDTGPEYIEGISQQQQDPLLYSYAKDQEWRNRILSGKDGPGMGEVMGAQAVSDLMKQHQNGLHKIKH